MQLAVVTCQYRDKTSSWSDQFCYVLALCLYYHTQSARICSGLNAQTQYYMHTLENLDEMIEGHWTLSLIWFESNHEMFEIKMTIQYFMVDSMSRLHFLSASSNIFLLGNIVIVDFITRGNVWDCYEKILSLYALYSIDF